MRRLALVFALFVAASAAGDALATEQSSQSQSMTIVGPSNPALSDGATALQEGRVEEGIRLTLDGLKRPTDVHDLAAGHSNLCAGYALLQRWDEALQECNASLALDKTNWRAFNNRAAALVGKGKYDLALSGILSFRRCQDRSLRSIWRERTSGTEVSPSVLNLFE